LFTKDSVIERITYVTLNWDFTAKKPCIRLRY